MPKVHKLDGSRKVKHLTPYPEELDRFVEWLSLPESERKPRSQAKMAVELGVHIDTLRVWKRDPRVISRVRSKIQGVLALNDLAGIVDGVLAGLPGDDQIVLLDPPLVADKGQRPSLLSDDDDAGDGLDIVGQIEAEAAARQTGAIHTDVGRVAVRPGTLIIRYEQFAVRRTLAKFLKRLQSRRQDFQACACRRAHDRLAKKLLPPTLCLSIIHHHITFTKIPGCTEIQQTAIQTPIKNNGCITQWTKCHSKWQIQKSIVNNFVVN